MIYYSYTIKDDRLLPLKLLLLAVAAIVNVCMIVALIGALALRLWQSALYYALGMFCAAAAQIIAVFLTKRYEYELRGDRLTVRLIYPLCSITLIDCALSEIRILSDSPSERPSARVPKYGANGCGKTPCMIELSGAEQRYVVALDDYLIARIDGGQQ